MRSLKLFTIALLAIAFCSEISFAQPEPKTADVMRLGNEAYSRKDYDAAFANYSKCLRIDPAAEHCAYNMGLSRSNQKKYEEAITHFGTAISINPKWSKPFAERGEMYSNLYKYDKCVADFSNAILYEPKTAEYLYGRGRCLQPMDRLTESVADFTAAYAISPQAKYLNERAFSYGRLKRYSEAYADLVKAKDSPVTTLFDVEIRAEYAAQIGKYDEAIAAYTQAIEMITKEKNGVGLKDSEIPLIYDTMAGIYKKQGRPTLAYSNYLSMLKLSDSIGLRKELSDLYSTMSTDQRAEVDRKYGKPPTVSVAQPPVKTPSRTTVQPPISAFDGLAKTETIAKAGNHAGVIDMATKTIALITMKAADEPSDTFMITLYGKLLTHRARAYYNLGKFLASDIDYERASQVALKGIVRHLKASFDKLEKATKESVGGSTLSVMEANAQTDYAIVVCQWGEPVAREYAGGLKSRNADTNSLVRGANKVANLKEMCSNSFIMSGGNLTSMAKMYVKTNTKLLNDAIAAYTQAIKYMPGDKMAYEERALVYHKLGKIDLARADEQKAAQLDTR